MFQVRAVSGSVRLVDFLDVERISVDFQAEGKTEVLHGLAALFDDTARGGTTVPATLALLQERESLASTGVGSGVAIPHARVPAVTRTVGAVAVSRAGVEFEAIDGEPVFVLVCLLAPRAPGLGSSDHLRALARISRVLRDESVRSVLRQAKQPAEVLATLVEADQETTVTE